MKNKHLNILIIFVIILFLWFFTFSCKNRSNSNGSSSSNMNERIISVKTLTVNSTENDIISSYVGTIKEGTSTLLSFQIPGTVKDIYVEEGEQVTSGQLLASLDKTSLQSAYDATKATLDAANDAYSRLEKVYKKGSLPEIKWVEIQSKVRQAKSAEEIACKALQNAELYAPSNGIITNKYINLGSNVLPGVMSFKIVNIDNIYVNISVPENEISNIYIGETVRITIAALNDSILTGKITEKSFAANLLSHTYNVKVKLSNKNHLLIPGMVCKAEIMRKNASNELVIPVNAVQVSYTNQYFVWVNENNIAKRRFISIGNFVNSSVVIREGLLPGDKVIIEGIQKISEGMKIAEQ